MLKTGIRKHTKIQVGNEHITAKQDTTLPTPYYGTSICWLFLWKPELPVAVLTCITSLDQLRFELSNDHVAQMHEHSYWKPNFCIAQTDLKCSCAITLSCNAYSTFILQKKQWGFIVYLNTTALDSKMMCNRVSSTEYSLDIIYLLLIPISISISKTYY